MFQTLFLRSMNTDMCIYTNTYTIMYTYIYKNTCTYTYACTRFGGWWCGVVWCCVVLCGVLLSWCPCLWFSQT